jgi:RNA polymerase primary sigma factor
MKCHTLGRRYDLVEEVECDYPCEEMGEKDLDKTVLVDTAQETEQEEFSSLPHSPSSDAPGSVSAPLSIYFKTISSFPLLNEREERILAQRIKEKEHGCKTQIIFWNQLLKDSVLQYCSLNQLKVIREKFYRIDEAFRFFDRVIMWEQERKKNDRALRQRFLRSHTKQELQEQLCKAEAEISKCIAEIQISKTTGSRVLQNLKKIAWEKKQQIHEKSLMETLSQISHQGKEVKLLKNQLIQANLRLVISIAKRYLNRGLALADLIQEGNLGLIRAVDTYDYRRGHRFITYATWWIKQAMIRAHDYQSRTVRTPVYINEKLHQIEKASNRLLQKGNREPTLEEIAAEANTSPGMVEMLKQNFRETVLLDTVTGEGSENIPRTALQHKMPSTSDHVSSRDLAHTIDLILSHLTPRERQVVKLRFGIGETYDHTLEQIGGKFNISRERIRQILEVSLDELRKSEHIKKLKDLIELH